MVLPLAVAPLERSIPSPDELRVVENAIEIAASPETVWRVGLGKLCNVAVRYETKERRLGRTLRERVGILLAELDRMQEQVRGGRDDFMTAFWAGYCLQGYDRPRKPKAVAAGTKGGEQ